MGLYIARIKVAMDVIQKGSIRLKKEIAKCAGLKKLLKIELRGTGCRLLKGNGKEEGMELSREGYRWPAGTLSKITSSKFASHCKRSYFSRLVEN